MTSLKKIRKLAPTASRVALASMCIIVAGCATTPAQLRASGPEHQTRIVVQQAYQATYRALLERQRSCEQTGLVTASVVVDGDLYTDIRSGTITTALHGGFGVKTMTVIDLKAIDDVSTDVVITSQESPGYIEKYRTSVQRWLAGDHDCVVRA